MSQRTSTPFQRAIDVIEALPLEDQETLIDLVHRRLIERRRAEIVRHAAETLQAVREGRAQYGTVEDLRRDLLAEPFDPSAELRAAPAPSPPTPHHPCHRDWMDYRQSDVS